MEITKETIASAIQASMKANPAVDGVFISKDTSLLADILGGMIARNIDSLPEGTIQGEHLEAFQRWA